MLNPKVGMRVRVTDQSCCDGGENGDIGIIREVLNLNSFDVVFTKEVSWMHCKTCVEEINE